VTSTPDMSPPGPESEPYDVPRGTCPSCGSGAVVHHVYGYLEDPSAMERAPGWVQWEGCVRNPWTRSCRACGFEWDEGEVP
jgi:hypothetical protein